MGALLFSHFRVTSVKLINEKNFLYITVSKWHGLHHSVMIFFDLAYFVISTYVIFIWVIWILMAHVQQQMASSIIYLFTRLHKTFSSCEPKEEWPHAGLYKYNGRQTGLFHKLMLLWSAWDWCCCTDFLITWEHQNRQRFIIERMFSMLLISREFE